MARLPLPPTLPVDRVLAAARRVAAGLHELAAPLAAAKPVPVADPLVLTLDPQPVRLSGAPVEVPLLLTRRVPITINGAPTWLGVTVVETGDRVVLRLKPTDRRPTRALTFSLTLAAPSADLGLVLPIAYTPG